MSGGLELMVDNLVDALRGSGHRAEVVALRRDRRAVSVAEAVEGFLAATDLAASTRAVATRARTTLESPKPYECRPAART